MQGPDGFKPKPDANTSENYQKIRKIGVDIEKAAIYFINIDENGFNRFEFGLPG